MPVDGGEAANSKQLGPLHVQRRIEYPLLNPMLLLVSAVSTVLQPRLARHHAVIVCSALGSVSPWSQGQRGNQQTAVRPPRTVWLPSQKQRRVRTITSIQRARACVKLMVMALITFLHGHQAFAASLREGVSADLRHLQSPGSNIGYAAATDCTSAHQCNSLPACQLYWLHTGLWQNTRVLQPQRQGALARSWFCH